MTDSFPAKLPIQIIGPTTLRRAHEDYEARWRRRWPHGNSHLAELIIDAKAHLDLGPSSKSRPEEVREITLDLMRADHEF